MTEKDHVDKGGNERKEKVFDPLEITNPKKVTRGKCFSTADTFVRPSISQAKL